MLDIKINGKNSKQLELNKKDGMKILKGAGIAVGGCLLTYITELLPMINFGEYKPIIVALAGILVNAGWKILQGKK